MALIDDYLWAKLPPLDDDIVAGVGAPVVIRRDDWGVAHIAADNLTDAFFGLGYAMAQDRLWHLDYQRRLARGELAAILGPAALPGDRVMRLLGMAAAGERGLAQSSPEEIAVFEALAAGINTWTRRVLDLGDARLLPLEFELLDYRPEPWRPANSVAVWKHRWWSLTGRLEQTVVGDAARRLLPPELLAIFLQTEAGSETIVPGREGTTGKSDLPSTGSSEGSNNWIVGPRRTSTGAPVLCSDPHNAIGLPSQWFEAHLTCPGLDVAGAFYIGTPMLYLGRNRDVAWGLTNHAVSVRDLYREEVHPVDPNLYRQGDGWVRFESERHTISVAGAPSVELEVRQTIRGPIVNPILPFHGQIELPVEGQAETPISLRWYGAEADSGLAASLGLIRAQSADDVVETLRRWPCPPLNFVYADRTGQIGYHAAGRVPQRRSPGNQICAASDPAAEWSGFVPYDEMPNERDPARGWLATANNVPWLNPPDTDWYLSQGHWSDGYRFRRIQQRITATEQLAPFDVAAIHGDIVSGRAEELLPYLRAALTRADSATASPTFLAARTWLDRWEGDFTLESVGATIWAAFWDAWCESVARARFPEELVESAAGEVGAVANRLLLEPSITWFTEQTTTEAVEAAFEAAMELLSELHGSDPAGWQWGQLHTIKQIHPLGNHPGFQQMYNIGPHPTTGGPTVRAAGYQRGQPFAVQTGSSYRMMADLSQPDLLWTVQTAGQSAQLGSFHYRDQTSLWLANRYHPFWMSPADVLAHCVGETRIRPEGGP